jgi:DNA uptake protein ComE-like DNA-binding protein
MLRRLILVCLACAVLVSPLLAKEEDDPKIPVDLNVATQAELAELPGIGEVIAQRIVRHREISGPAAAGDSEGEGTGSRR